MYTGNVEEMDFSDGFWNFLHVNDSADAMYNVTTSDSILHLSTIFIPVKFVLCFMSFLTSLVNVRVLTRHTMNKSSMNVLMVSLHLSTLVLSVFEKVTLVLRFVLGAFVSVIVVIDSVSDTSSSVCVYFINWITSVISFWRLVEIRCPERSGKLLTRRKAIIIIIVLVILAVSPDSVLNALGSLKLNIIGKFSSLKMLTNTTAIEEYIKQKLNIKGNFSSLDLANASEFEQYLEESGMSPTYSLIIKWVGYLVKTFQYVFPLGSFFATSFYSLKKACTTKAKEDLLLKCTSNIHLDAAQIKKTFILLTLLGSYMLSTTLEPIIELLPSTGTIKVRFESIVGGFAFTHVTNILSFFAHYHSDPEFKNSFWKHFKRRNPCESVRNNELMETGSFEMQNSH